MKKLDIEEIHSATLDLFKIIIEICEKLNINYFIAYGTLIGAVRHKGFIPWDDDFDIIMIREDFDKFTKYCHKNINNNFGKYKLIDSTNTNNYPYTIPRFCDLSYTMISDEFPDLNTGIFIDIYPFDGVGNSIKKAKRKVEIKKFIYINCLVYSIKKKYEKSDYFFKNIIKYPLFLFSKNKKPRYFINRLDKLKKIYDFTESNYIGCVVWDVKLNPIEKWHYENFEFLDFENIKVKVPIGYDEVLRNSYGNYMILPPKDKQKPTHNYEVYK